MGRKFKENLDRKLYQPILGFLKQGMTPDKLALSIALGFAIGLFPVIGVTTIICFLVSLALRLNIAAIQLANYFVYPLQLILLIPMIKVGSWMLDINPIPFSITQLLDMFNADFLNAIEKLWLAHLIGIFTWAVFIIPFSVFVYAILRYTFRKMAIS
jgi:uncharacterized protein (DUF2062 family)